MGERSADALSKQSAATVRSRNSVADNIANFRFHFVYPWQPRFADKSTARAESASHRHVTLKYHNITSLKFTIINRAE